jgi:hypothetical protein
MHPIEEATGLLEQSRRCRRFSDAVTDEVTKQKLRAMSAEYANRANRLTQQCMADSFRDLPQHFGVLVHAAS